MSPHSTEEKEERSAAPRTLHLKKKADQRLIRGHDWVFSNELQPPPKLGLDEAGRVVHLVNHQGKFLASGYYNPKSLIAVRVLSREPMDQITAEWLMIRFRRALARRESVFQQPYYRLVYGESDGLPGLVIDRFGPYLVVQITTAGMERVKPAIQAALQEVLNPTGIVWRADDRFRELEGLPVQEPETTGDVPDVVPVIEGDLVFETRLSEGQKTGWYFDQRDNRLRLHRYAHGKRVLDVFSYAGAWGLHALAAGAASATCIDSSKDALLAAQKSAQLQGRTIETICDDAFAALRGMLKENRRFDIVVIDPPPLIKRKKDFEAGLQAYYQLNRLAAQLLVDGGLLVSCSCSHHLSQEQLVEILRHTSMQFNRPMAIAESGGQAIDHPVHPAMIETAYLKALFAWVG